MNIIRRAITTLGGVLLAALLIAALAPKATRGIAAALVQVTNTASSPVPNRDVDNPATEPFDVSLCVAKNFGTDPCGSETNSFIVPTTTPDGRAVTRVVIEQVSGLCFTTQTVPLDLELFRLGTSHPAIVIPSSIDSTGGIDFSLLVRLYLNPGEEVVFGPATGNIYVCHEGVFGYLVAK